MSNTADRLKQWWDSEEPFAKTLLGALAVSTVLGLGMSASVETASNEQPANNTVDVSE